MPHLAPRSKSMRPEDAPRRVPLDPALPGRSDDCRCEGIDPASAWRHGEDRSRASVATSTPKHADPLWRVTLPDHPSSRRLRALVGDRERRFSWTVRPVGEREFLSMDGWPPPGAPRAFRDEARRDGLPMPHHCILDEGGRLRDRPQPRTDSATDSRTAHLILFAVELSAARRSRLGASGPTAMRGGLARPRAPYMARAAWCVSTQRFEPIEVERLLGAAEDAEFEGVLLSPSASRRRSS